MTAPRRPDRRDSNWRPYVAEVRPPELWRPEPTLRLPFVADDGGRAADGYRGHTGDCVARSVAIASGRPYREVYDRLAAENAAQRRSPRERANKTSRTGVRTAARGINVRRLWFARYMAELGFRWVPTMAIGSGCLVHLRAGELPARAALVVAVSKHYTAVVNGEIRDTYDPSREGTRCVYGYWIRDGVEEARPPG